MIEENLLCKIQQINTINAVLLRYIYCSKSQYLICRQTSQVQFPYSEEKKENKYQILTYNI